MAQVQLLTLFLRLFKRILRTTFIQKFRLSGGARGRIARGDEVVKLEMTTKSTLMN